MDGRGLMGDLLVFWTFYRQRRAWDVRNGSITGCTQVGPEGGKEEVKEGGRENGRENERPSAGDVSMRPVAC